MKTLNRNLFCVTLLLPIIITFNGCGTGGDTDSNRSTEEKISLDVNCTTPAQIDDYISIYSGDIIIKTQENTTIETYHSINGTKKICLISGGAYIIRK